MATARKETAAKRMRAEHAAGILRWLIKHPEAAADVRLTTLIESAIGKLTDTAFDFEDARDSLYAAAGHAKGAGNRMWSAAADDAINVLQAKWSGDRETRHLYNPDGTLRLPTWQELTIPSLQGGTAQTPAGPAQRAKAGTPRRTHVYVIRSSGSKLVKIGYAVNPGQRVRELQTGSPEKLAVAWSIPGREQLERELHRRFAAHRKSGEWFDLTQLGDAVTVVREEADQIRKEAASRGHVARYFYDA